MGDNNPIQAGKTIDDFESLIYTDTHHKPDDSKAEPVEKNDGSKSEFVTTDRESQKLTETRPRPFPKIFRS